ncbi:MAG: glycosyltransferase [candidate division KSB1 bacterium]|nr:glycosyltransferase [candidate division KSB1 bacterium]
MAEVEARLQPSLSKAGGAENRRRPRVSVVVVLSDNAEEVAEVAAGIRQLTGELGLSYEVLFVDDGSRDSTFERLTSGIEGWPEAQAVRLRARFGEAAALAAALQLSRGEIILYQTVRVRPNPRDLRRLLQRLEEGYDMVVGWRYPRRDSLLNRAISRAFNWMVNRLTGLRLHDVNSGVFAVRRQVLESLQLYGDLNSFLAVMAERQGYRVSEERIEQLPGWFRQSRYPREYLHRALDIITVIFLTRYSKKPLHFLGFLGAVFALVGTVISGYLFFYRLLGFGAIAGRPLLLLGVLLLVIGIQMISIGLLGEMIIFTHARDIREYSIEKIIGQADGMVP